MLVFALESCWVIVMMTIVVFLLTRHKDGEWRLWWQVRMKTWRWRVTRMLSRILRSHIIFMYALCMHTSLTHALNILFYELLCIKMFLIWPVKQIWCPFTQTQTVVVCFLSSALLVSCKKNFVQMSLWGLVIKIFCRLFWTLIWLDSRAYTRPRFFINSILIAVLYSITPHCNGWCQGRIFSARK